MAAISRAIVVGAGIGGLTAALALEQSGVDVTVYDRVPSLDALSQGGGLVLWHNAVRALRSLGLEDALQAAGHELTAHEFLSWRGERLAHWPVADVTARAGASAFAVSRPVLHRLLLDALGDRVRPGHAFDRFDVDGDVLVRFANGAEDRGDLLVGADGLRSAVRAQLRPYDPPPRYAGYTAWQGVVRCDAPAVTDGLFANLWGRGKRFLWFRLDDDGLVYWDGITSDRIAHAMRATGMTKRRFVAREFAGWPGPITELVAATDEDRILPTHVYDRAPVEGWSSGPVVLLGDAAHPMTFNLGQGACQAVEDGVVLARHLTASRSRHQALATYEQERAPRTAEMVTTSRIIGAVGRWQSRPACWVRETFMRTMFDGPIFRQNESLMLAGTV
jgi:2-polyprenyl-6-methoxyphenol hydroxylase-like FAD-dependent oxidoreductase